MQLTRRLDNALGSVHGLSFGDFMILYHLDRAPGTRLRHIDLAEPVQLAGAVGGQAAGVVAVDGGVIANIDDAAPYCPSLAWRWWLQCPWLMARFS